MIFSLNIAEINKVTRAPSCMKHLYALFMLISSLHLLNIANQKVFSGPLCRNAYRKRSAKSSWSLHDLDKLIISMLICGSSAFMVIIKTALTKTSTSMKRRVEGTISADIHHRLLL